EPAAKQSARHNRSQESVLARSGVKHSGRHGRDEDWEVQSERADQKQHGKHGFQVGSIPHIAKTLGEAPLGSESSIPRMKLIDAKETQRAEHCSKRGGADQEHPAGARG